MAYRLISFVCLIALVSCGKPAPTLPAADQAKPTTPAARSEPIEKAELSPGAVDACSLLKPDEMQSIIGEPVTNSQRSGKAEAGLDVSQCYLAATTPSNSVSLVVVQKGTGSSARDPKAQWEQTFEGDHPDNDEGEERKKPEKIDGLGDEAFWIGNPIGSALYVLKVNTYIRISVGGSADQATKLEKSKAIAHLMLPRL